MMSADSTARLSDALMRRLHLISQGKRAQHADRMSMATIVLDGMLEQRGLVRTIKHRDNTRSYALTDAGHAILNTRSPSETKE